MQGCARKLGDGVLLLLDLTLSWCIGVAEHVWSCTRTSGSCMCKVAKKLRDGVLLMPGIADSFRIAVAAACRTAPVMLALQSISCLANVALFFILLMRVFVDEDQAFITCANDVDDGSPSWNGYLLGIAVAALLLSRLSKQSLRLSMLMPGGAKAMHVMCYTMVLSSLAVSAFWIVVAQTERFWTGRCMTGMIYLDGIGAPSHSQTIAWGLGLVWLCQSMDCLLWLWCHACPGPNYASMLEHFDKEQKIRFNSPFGSGVKFLSAVVPKAAGAFATHAIASMSTDGNGIQKCWVSVVLYLEFVHALNTNVSVQAAQRQHVAEV